MSLTCVLCGMALLLAGILFGLVLAWRRWPWACPECNKPMPIDPFWWESCIAGVEYDSNHMPLPKASTEMVDKSACNATETSF